MFKFIEIITQIHETPIKEPLYIYFVGYHFIKLIEAFWTSLSNINQLSLTGWSSTASLWYHFHRPRKCVYSCYWTALWSHETNVQSSRNFRPAPDKGTYKSLLYRLVCHLCHKQAIQCRRLTDRSIDCNDWCQFHLDREPKCPVFPKRRDNWWLPTFRCGSSKLHLCLACRLESGSKEPHKSRNLCAKLVNPRPNQCA